MANEMCYFGIEYDKSKQEVVFILIAPPLVKNGLELPGGVTGLSYSLNSTGASQPGRGITSDRDKIVYWLSRKVPAALHEIYSKEILKELSNFIAAFQRYVVNMTSLVSFEYDYGNQALKPTISPSVQALTESLPGINEIVNPPCSCKDLTRRFLSSVIIHLNDYHRWTREEIADWLESLDLDLEFK